VWLVTTVSLVIALVAVALAVQARSDASRAQSRVAALEADVRGLEQRVGADEQAAAIDRRHIHGVAASASRAGRAAAQVSWQLQSVPSEAQLAVLRSQLASYTSCLPQLQAELNRLGISWRIDPRKPASDYFKLSSAAPVSTTCSALLNRG
jgi:hypothetical protein